MPIGGFIAVRNYAPELLDDFYVRAFCTGVATANAVRFWIAMRGIRSNAQKMVRRQIENMATPMRVGRPRKF